MPTGSQIDLLKFLEKHFAPGKLVLDFFAKEYHISGKDLQGADQSVSWPMALFLESLRPCYKAMVEDGKAIILKDSRWSLVVKEKNVDLKIIVAFLLKR